MLNNIIDEVSEGIQGVSWKTSKEYITIKQTIKYTITWAHKTWLKLLQIDASVRDLKSISVWSFTIIIAHYY